VCSLNDDRRLDAEILRLDSTRWRPRTVAQSGVLACLGDRERRAAMREALISQRDEDVRIAQVYYRYRPVDDPSELRAIATGIGRIRDADTQVRALNTLGAHRLSDPVTLEALARLFPSAETAGVQSAIAGVLIRANYHVLERSDLLNTLTQHQLPGKRTDPRRRADPPAQAAVTPQTLSVSVGVCPTATLRVRRRMRILRAVLSPRPACRRVFRRSSSRSRSLRRFARACDDVKTVCTITVNSPDEKETLQRHLPPDRYRFVELVEKGRPDWLASSCRAGVRCDVLVISGHFDDGDAFYTDRLDQRENLPVDELERVSCSESCPGVFSQLKEVYLFGCNTLNALPRRSASPEMSRSLVRAGYSAAEAETIARGLAERHAESNRDRMRHVFKDVPTIYGFSGKAPLGRYAGPMLDRYLTSGGAGEVASGKPSPALLGTFSKVGMVALPGLSARTRPRACARTRATSTTSASRRRRASRSCTTCCAGRPRKCACSSTRSSAGPRRSPTRRAPSLRAPRRSTRSRPMPRPASGSSCSRATPTSRRCACA
jgi:hypothetical protein